MSSSESWVLFYTSEDMFRVEFVKGMLVANDIESVVVNKKDSSYLIGPIELYVSVADAFEANQLLTQHNLEQKSNR